MRIVLILFDKSIKKFCRLERNRMPRLSRTMYEGKPLLYLSGDQTWKRCHVHQIVYDEGGHAIQTVIVEIDETKDHYSIHTDDVNAQLKQREDADEGDIGNADLLHSSKRAALFLCNRHNQTQVYSKCGPVLVFMSHLGMSRFYGKSTIEEYRRPDKPFDQAPHLYGKLNEALLMAEMTQSDQNIILVGNRHSGKSMQMQKSIEFITHGNDRLLSSCQAALAILHSFGSVCMPENPNSSRFASLVSFFFQDGVASGCSLETCMLEVWRLVDATVDQKMFHLFYALHECTDLMLLRRIGFQRYEKKESFEYLKKTFDGATVCKGPSIGVLQAFCRELDVDPTTFNLWLSVACICLRLGNLTFVCTKDKAVVENVAEMDFIASKLGVAVEFLQEQLSAAPACQVQTVEEKERIWINEAKNRRDALACFIYKRLFEWVVRVINKKIKGVQRGAKVSVLDVQGFETGKNLGFDQLLVNYCNERLFQIFDSTINKNIQYEYEKENLKMQPIVSPPDNLVMIETNRVILRECLDRSALSALPSPTHFIQMVEASSVAKYVTFSGFKMTINHVAGPCQYDISMFPSQNKQMVACQFVDLLRQSDAFHSDLLLPSDGESQINKSPSLSPRMSRSPRGVPPSPLGIPNLDLSSRPRGTTEALSPSLGRMSPTLSRRRSSTITSSTGPPAVALPTTTASVFCDSFRELLLKLQRNSCHFIVCLVPGDESFVQMQLNSTRLTHAIDVCTCEGKPIHIPLVNLFQRYWMISPDSKKICSLSSLDPCEYAMGKTMAFFSTQCVARLEKLRYLIRRDAAKKILPLLVENRQRARNDKEKFLMNCLKVWLNGRVQMEETNNEIRMDEIRRRDEEIDKLRQAVRELTRDKNTLVAAIKTTFPSEWAIQHAFLCHVYKGTFNPMDTHTGVDQVFDFLYDNTLLFTAFHPDTFPLFAFVSARLIIYHGYSQDAVLSLYQVFNQRISILQDSPNVLIAISNLCFLISWMTHSKRIDSDDIVRFVHILNILITGVQKKTCDSLSVTAYEFVCSPSQTGNAKTLDGFAQQVQQSYTEMRKHNIPAMLIRYFFLSLMHNIDVRIANSIMLKSFVNVECTFTFQPDLGAVANQVVSVINDTAIIQRSSWKGFFPIVFDIIRLLSYPNKAEAVERPEMFEKLTDAHMLELISKYKFVQGEQLFDIQAVVYRLREKVGKRASEVSFGVTVRQFKQDQIAEQFCVIPSTLVCQVVSSATFSIESFLPNAIKRDQ